VVHRLGEVLVGTGLEPRDDVLRVGHHGHEDDRREGKIPHRLQPPAHLDAVELRHHDIEEDQVGPRRARDCEGLLTVTGGDDVVALAREARANDPDVARVVVDDQDARRSPHPDA